MLLQQAVSDFTNSSHLLFSGVEVFLLHEFHDDACHQLLASDGVSDSSNASSKTNGGGQYNLHDEPFKYGGGEDVKDKA